FFFFFHDTSPTEIYTLSLHDALPIWNRGSRQRGDLGFPARRAGARPAGRASRRTRPEGVRARRPAVGRRIRGDRARPAGGLAPRSEEHTSELQSRGHLVCRLLLEKKK